MKFLLVHLFFLLSFGIQLSSSIQPSNIKIQSISSVQQQLQASAIDYTCKYSQCHATAKSTGNRCKHCVSNKGDYNCWQHD